MLSFQNKLLCFLIVVAVLPACRENPQIEEQVRAIKTYTITELADGQQRKFPGVVQAADNSALSFEVAGKVKTVNVDIGDAVAKGQVLAELDSEPYKLDVQAAEADLAKARAEYTNRKKQFERIDELQKKGWASKAHWDASLAARDTSKNQINYAISKLNLAKRDLRLTVLKAPFDGNIASRSIDPHVEVRAGQKIFDINAKGALRVEFDIPETIISRVYLGLPVQVNFPTLSTDTSEGRLSFIGSAAGQANAFPVKADLLNPSDQIKPGMTADVNFILRDETIKSGYLAPLSALVPGGKEDMGYVFVFDKVSSTVKKIPIKAKGGGGQENMVQITEGVAAGDVIAIAGVSFLYDGQKVKLMQP